VSQPKEGTDLGLQETKWRENYVQRRTAKSFNISVRKPDETRQDDNIKMEI